MSLANSFWSVLSQLTPAHRKGGRIFTYHWIMHFFLHSLKPIHFVRFFFLNGRNCPFYSEPGYTKHKIVSVSSYYLMPGTFSLICIFWDFCWPGNSLAPKKLTRAQKAWVVLVRIKRKGVENLIVVDERILI